MDSDAFVTVLAAVIGVVGTLLGGLAGSIATYLIQAKLLKYQTQTRFHEQRLELYAEFESGVMRLFSTWQVGANDEDLIERMLKLEHKIMYVGSRKVADSCGEIGNIMTSVVDHNPPERRAATEAVFADILRAVSNFRTAARAELQIDTT